MSDEPPVSGRISPSRISLGSGAAFAGAGAWAQVGDRLANKTNASQWRTGNCIKDLQSGGMFLNRLRKATAQRFAVAIGHNDLWAIFLPGAQPVRPELRYIKPGSYLS